MPAFFAVESGNLATGYLVANGNVYPAVSGPFGKGNTPPGDYTYGKPERLNPKKNEYRSMTDAPNQKAATAERAEGFRKFHIGKGPKQDSFKDPRTGKLREGIEFHYDGNTPGTLGCIGYQDNAAMQALINDPNKTVHVEYNKSMEEVQQNIEKSLGKKVDWKEVESRRPQKAGGGGGGSGTHSKTRKGNKVKKGQKTVLLGSQQRQMAHRDSELEGGAKIAKGSSTVFVGEERLKVARVDDHTTDGSPVADGEETVRVG